jgi:hypothetical protein
MYSGWHQRACKRRIQKSSKKHQKCLNFVPPWAVPVLVVRSFHSLIKKVKSGVGRRGEICYWLMLLLLLHKK